MPEKQVPTKLAAFQGEAKKAAFIELEKSTETLEKLMATYDHFFPTTTALSALQQQYTASANVVAQNVELEGAVTATLDALDVVIGASTKYQQYITLTIPKMEDGGNFGVSIQLDALKNAGEISEKLLGKIEDLSKYSSARADALEKCKLPSTSQSKTSTTTSKEDSSTGDKEKGDTNTTNQSKSVEEKTIETVVTAAAAEASLRKAAVIAVDITYYTKAKAAMNQAILGYMAISDYADKNREKLEKPKGETGGRSGFSNMY